MHKNILKLIDLINELTFWDVPKEDRSNRDLHYQIVLDYNYGNPLWLLEHDGKLWQMEKYVPPSRNGFRTFAQAEAVMIETLLKVCRDAIEVEKTSTEPHPRLTELEIEYLVLEIAS